MNIFLQLGATLVLLFVLIPALGGLLSLHRPTAILLSAGCGVTGSVCLIIGAFVWIWQ